jgi:hypothetical protein
MSKQGTVAWLIEKLKKFPQDMEVLVADREGTYYNCLDPRIVRVHDGLSVDEDDEDGEDVVCIEAD